MIYITLKQYTNDLLFEREELFAKLDNSSYAINPLMLNSVPITLNHLPLNEQDKSKMLGILFALFLFCYIEDNQESIKISVPSYFWNLRDEFNSIENPNISILNDSFDGPIVLAINNAYWEEAIIYQSKNSIIAKIILHQYNLIVKIKNCSLTDPERLFLNYTNNSIVGLNHIYVATNTNVFQHKSLIVSDYIEGVHIHGLLDKQKESNLINTIISTNSLLSRINTIGMNSIPSIEDKLTSCILQAKNESVVILGNTLLGMWNAKHIVYSQICLYDLHRDNLLYSDSSSWHIIDTESILLGTNTFMFSCLLSASFLLEGYNTKKVIEVLPKQYKKSISRICYEILIRLYIGISFFSITTKNCTNENPNLYTRYLDEFIRFLIELQGLNYISQKEIQVLLEASQTCR